MTRSRRTIKGQWPGQGRWLWRRSGTLGAAVMLMLSAVVGGMMLAAPAASADTTCAPGSYLSDSTCVAASPGNFVPGSGATSQIPCPAGFYQPLVGQTSCDPANPGSFVAIPGQEAPQLCPAGEYQPGIGASSCDQAAPGSFVAGPGQAEPQLCPAGDYQPNSGASGCVEASPGSFVPGPGQAEPQLCPAGTYQPGFGASGCIAADADFFVPSPGSTGETRCPAGTFQPFTGQTACLPDLAISTTSLPSGTAGTAYSETLAATGGTAPYDWQVTGPLPSGLTLDSGTGMISGTPSSAGSFPVTVTASDASSPQQVATQSLTLTVTVAPVAPQITSVGGDTVPGGSPFSYPVTATGTPTPALSLSSPSSLPAGVTFTDNLDGTATLAGGSSVVPGVYTFTLQAANGIGANATQAFTLTVAPQGAPSITSSAGTTVTAGTAMAPFTITTNGFPTPALTRKGPLPAGVNFTDNHNGTATISGNPKASDGGIYVLTITATNAQGTAPQTFTLVVNQAPTVTSRASTTFTTGVPGTFTVTTDGYPTPALTYSGALPPGATFTDNGDGTATISGIPAADGGYPVMVTATNAAGGVSQSLTINVDQDAAITSAQTATATAGAAMAPFTIATTGFPVPSLSRTGALPAGVTFTNNHDGTATISGVPKATQGGIYLLTITASSNQGTVTQPFTLVVDAAPTVTSRASTVFTAGDFGTFTVTTNGYPAPALTYSGALPPGVTFIDNGDGTATISGVPATDGTYPIVITATNSFGGNSESLTIKVS